MILNSVQVYNSPSRGIIKHYQEIRANRRRVVQIDNCNESGNSKFRLMWRNQYGIFEGAWYLLDFKIEKNWDSRRITISEEEYQRLLSRRVAKYVNWKWVEIQNQ